jgi:putative addiction module component (TIGR02574 family)
VPGSVRGAVSIVVAARTSVCTDAGHRSRTLSARGLSITPAGGNLRVVANVVPIPPPGFDDLTPEEKVRYVGALWDRVIDDQANLPVSDAQRMLIRERLAAHQANPRAARPWSEVRREIEETVAERRSR